MSFDDLVVVEFQDFIDQAVVLVAVHDDDGIDSLIDALDDKPKVGNCAAMPGSSSAGVQACRERFLRFPAGALAATGEVNTTTSWKCPQDGPHIVGIPCLHPLLTEGERIEVHGRHCNGGGAWRSTHLGDWSMMPAFAAAAEPGMSDPPSV